MSKGILKIVKKEGIIFIIVAVVFFGVLEWFNQVSSRSVMHGLLNTVLFIVAFGYPLYLLIMIGLWIKNALKYDEAVVEFTSIFSKITSKETLTRVVLFLLAIYLFILIVFKLFD